MEHPPREPYLELLSQSFAKPPSESGAEFSVLELLEDGNALGLSALAGSGGLSRPIKGNKIQKPGLALTGFLAYLDGGRIQVLGRADVAYLWQLGPRLNSTLLPMMEHGVVAMVVTRDQKVPPDFLAMAENYGIPLLSSPLTGGDLVEGLISILDRRLSPRVHFHGNLIGVYGLGVLVLGRSGVGKSECALDLVMRGHRLVADDIVLVRRLPTGQLMGACEELIRDHMEIRGLGIINVKDLFSITATATEHQVDFSIYLDHWDASQNYQMVGLDVEEVAILGVKIPLIHLPVAPGRNISNLIEVAARNHLLRRMGHHSAHEFSKKLESKLAARRRGE